jgi:hypothetical protein
VFLDFSKVFENRMEKSIQINRPFGKVGLWAFLWLVLFIGMAEVVVRFKPVQSRLLLPGLGGVPRTFESQIYRLNTRFEQGERIDCVFIGSSRVLYGVDPATIRKAYSNITGTDFKCENFGVLGMGIKGSATTASLVQKLYHPRLIIIGTSFLDIPLGAPDDAIVGNPFVRYNLGSFNLDGWVTTRSLAFRDYLAEISYLAIDDPHTKQDYLRYGLTRLDGFLPVRGHKADNLQNWDNLNAHYKITAESTRPVKAILALKQENTQILFIEMPLRTSTFNSVPHTNTYRQAFKDAINPILENGGGQIWYTQDLNLIPESGWFESNHLNIAGAETFSAWVGEQLGKTVKNGSLILPEWGQTNP